MLPSEPEAPLTARARPEARPETRSANLRSVQKNRVEVSRSEAPFNGKLKICGKLSRSCGGDNPAFGRNRSESCQGTTVTGHRAAFTSRTASEPTSRWPACADAPTTTASARISSAMRRNSANGSPQA